MRRVIIVTSAVLMLLAAGAPSQACPAGYALCGVGVCCPR